MLVGAPPPSDAQLSATERLRLSLASHCHAMAQALGLRRLADYVVYVRVGCGEGEGERRE